MTLQVYTGAKEFSKSHERRAIQLLLREMATRFGNSVDPYALFIDFSVWGDKIDMLALTSRAIFVIELKDLGEPNGVIFGTENGPWFAELPNGSFELNSGRWNPFLQLSHYRDTLTDWLKEEAKQIFGTQAAKQLNFRKVQARVVCSPSLDRDATRSNLKFIRHPLDKWFDVVGLDHICDELYATTTESIQIYQEDIERFAQLLGLTRRIHLDDILVSPQRLLPNPHIFSRPAVSRFHLGRDKELEDLTSALNDPAYAIVAIAGPVGIGKTHLASKLCESLSVTRPVYWISCDDHPEMTLETLLFAFANELPDSTQAQVVADSYEHESTRLHIATHFMETHGVLLVLDNYHRLSADSGFERFFERADRYFSRAKILLTTRYRPELTNKTGTPIKSFYEILLTGLSPKHVISYLNQQPNHLHLDLSHADAAEIWQKTGGVPRILDFLAQSSRGQSLAVITQARPVYNDETARMWYRDLLSHVPSDAYKLVRKLSVMRRPFSRAVIAELDQSNNLSQLIDILLDNYVLVATQSPGHFAIGYQLRDFLYEETPDDMRRRTHERVAKILMERIPQLSQDLSALDLRAEALYHAYQAKNWSLVLQHAPDVADQFHVFGEDVRARRIAQRAFDAATQKNDNQQLAYWHIQLARFFRRTNELDHALEHCQQGLNMAQALSADALLASGYHQMGMLALKQKDHANARIWYQKALDVFQGLGMAADAAKSLGKLGDIDRAERRSADALAKYRACVELTEHAGNLAGLAVTFTQMGTLAKYDGNLHDSRAYFQRSLDIATRFSQPVSRIIALSNLAEVTARLGQPNEALQLIDQNIELLNSLPIEYSYRIALGIKIDILIQLERIDEAEHLLEALEQLCRQANDDLSQIFAQRRRGQIAVIRGQNTEGMNLIVQASQAFRKAGRSQYADDCERILAEYVPT